MRSFFGKKSSPTKEEYNPILAEFLGAIFLNKEIMTIKDAHHHLEKHLRDHLNLNQNEMDYLVEMDKKCQMIKQNKTPIPIPSSIKDSEKIPSISSDPQLENILPHTLEDPLFHDNEEDKTDFNSFSGNESSSLFLNKCKRIGKIGPDICLLNKKSVSGNATIRDGIDIISGSRSCSIKANTGVFKGKWYFEARLITGGVAYIGWTNYSAPFGFEMGVGDTKDSYAYDGKHAYKWNGHRIPYGEHWGSGDIIGSFIDFQKQEISFCRNGKNLGVAFYNIPIGENRVYFPAITLMGGERVVFNFGKRQLVNQNCEYKGINEPESVIKGYYNTAVYLLESFKRFLTESQKFQLSENDKSLVCAIIMEYLSPLMQEINIMERLILSFFIELDIFNSEAYWDMAMNFFISYCTGSELKKWCGLFFKVILENSTNYVPSRDDYYNDKNKYYLLLDKILDYEEILAKWFQSPKINIDLENLYFMTIFQKSDINKLFPILYFPEIDIFPLSNQTLFSKTMQKYMRCYINNQQLLFNITDKMMNSKPIYMIDEGKIIPKKVVINFLDFLIKKNAAYTHQMVLNKPDLTHIQSLTNFCFAILRYCEPVLDIPPSEYPFTILYTDFVDPGFSKLERIGGSLTHLQAKYHECLSKLSIPNISTSNTQIYEILNKVIILMNYGVILYMGSLIRGIEKYNLLGRNIDELSEEGTKKHRKNLEKEIIQTMKQSLPYYFLFFTPTSIRLMHKLGKWITDTINYIDDNSPKLFYFIPEYYVTISFEIIRIFLRLKVEEADYVWVVDNLEPSKFPSEQFLKGYMGYVCRHLFDVEITNPDLQDSFLTKFNLFLQYKNLIPFLESHPIVQTNLIPGLTSAFQKKNLNALSKNFLRLFRNNSFNDIQFTVLPESPSIYYQEKLREYFHQKSDQKENFFNNLFGHLHSVNSELRLAYVESNNSQASLQQRVTQGREAKRLFGMLYDLMRVVESCIKLAPKDFVTLNGIMSSRLADFIMTMLRQIIDGQLSKIMQLLFQTDYLKIQTKEYFISPLLGMIKNVHEYFLKFHKSELITPIEKIISNADGFEIRYFTDAKKIIKSLSSTMFSHDENSLELVQDAIERIENYSEENNLGIKPFLSKGKSQEDEENVCSICYNAKCDRIFIPCEHKSCLKCITIHMSTSKICPFCKFEIVRTETYDPNQEESKEIPQTHSTNFENTQQDLENEFDQEKLESARKQEEDEVEFSDLTELKEAK